MLHVEQILVDESEKIKKKTNKQKMFIYKAGSFLKSLLW